MDRNIVTLPNGNFVNFIPSTATAIVIANQAVLPAGLLYVGTGGDVAAIPSGQTGYVVFKNVPSGSFLPIYIIGVGNLGAGTTATDLLVCY